MAESRARSLQFCKYCDYKSNDSRNVKVHIGKMHGGDNPYFCQLCKTRFKLKTELTAHWASGIHSGKNPFPCDFCDKRFPRLVELNSHRLIHLEKQHKCPVCSKLFRHKSSLKSHIILHTGERGFTCIFCNKGFPKVGALNHHYHRHTREKPYFCSECPYSNADSKGLREHIKAKHPETAKNKFGWKGPDKCHWCRKEFSNKGNFNIHMDMHFPKKQIKCQLCPKSFTLEGNYQAHLRRHTGEKPYKCQYCKMAFGDKTDMRKHEVVHTGNKPFQCDLCEMKFIQIGLLRAHIEKWHINPFKCTFCKGKFPDGENLRVHLQNEHPSEFFHICIFCGKMYQSWTGLLVHMNGHTGEKPEFCQMCDESFGDRHQLKMHMRSNHQLTT